ncbi:kinesin motor domain-containing protein [Xylariales sp. AK1849]|nr:kinesin motor domain-containing protein [Xylariales sp. AK1849]
MALQNERKTANGEVVAETKEFDFERIFGHGDDNKAVYKEISDLTQCAIEGQNVCIFSYGQTGSGKTYTMSSNNGLDDGIIPRTFAMIFDITSKMQREYRYTVELSAIEIHMDNLFDLLQSPINGKKAAIKLHEAGSHPLNWCKAANELLETAFNNRAVGATKMNEHSSRSHLILTLKVARVPLEGSGKSVTGILNLVDLAGSERASSAGTQGAQLNEGIAINSH